MAIEIAFHDYLGSVDEVAAIVTDRIYCDHIPQETPTLPALVWNKTATDHEHVLSGGAGCAIASFDVISLSRDLVEAGALSETVRTALQGYHGTWSAYRINCVTLDQDWIDCTPNNDGSDFNSVYQMTHSYNVQYQESIPTF